MKEAQMSMQEIAGFLLSDHEVTDGVTENVPAEEMISVTDSAPKTPEKRKRGRPSKTGGAMTAAERARRYRQKHRPAWKGLRVELWPSRVDRAKDIAEKAGISLELMVNHALGRIREEEWGEMEETWIRHTAKELAQSGAPDVAA